YTYLIALAMFLGGCTSYKIIPDGELVRIFHDAFLTNAYITNKSFKLDSLNVYEPIFESYGYTTEDVQYTIGNFSKRKSARLGDIVERAIVMLEYQGLLYEWDVAILDTISAKSQRQQIKTIFEKDEILVASQRDTTKLFLSIDNIKTGDYVLTFDYVIDSLDKNFGTYRTVAWFEIDGNLTPDSLVRRYDESVRYLQRGKDMTHKNTLTAKREYDRMMLEVVDIMGKKERPHFTVQNIKVDYTPTSDVAEQMQFEDMLNIKIFSDELLPLPTPKDSI
ncbi:MAG: DUF4296 domain-containing protein, partial [Rikenellaceae bacterium]